jgi:NAD(P)H dehydrogenase (quinone)
MKGWCDKSFLFGHSWSDQNTFDKGLLKGKNCLSIITCGDIKENFQPGGHQDITIENLMHHFHHATLAYTGMSVLKPLVIYGNEIKSEEGRNNFLSKVDGHLKKFEQLPFLHKLH